MVDRNTRCIRETILTLASRALTASSSSSSQFFIALSRRMLSAQSLKSFHNIDATVSFRSSMLQAPPDVAVAAASLAPTTSRLMQPLQRRRPKSGAATAAGGER
jgi:hypothetical protein